MNKLLILLLVFSMSANAGLSAIVKSGAKALKKDIEPSPATIKKEIDGEAGAKKTDELSDADNKTFEEAFYGIEDLDPSLSIEDYLGIGALKSGKSKASGKKSSSSSAKSKKIKFSKEDFRKSSFNLRNKQNIDKAPSARMFFSWLSLRLGTETHKALSDEAIDELNRDLELSFEDETPQKSDDDSRKDIYSTSLSIHKEVMRQMDALSDAEEYSRSLGRYYDYLLSWGWNGFSATSIYDQAKMEGASWGQILGETAGFLALTKKDDQQEVRKKLREDLVRLVSMKSNAAFIYHLDFCSYIRTMQPLYSFTLNDRLSAEFCSPNKLFESADNLEIPEEIPKSYKDLLKVISVYEMSFQGVSDEYVFNRNNLMLQVPTFIDDQIEETSLADALMLLGLAELNVGNLENAFDIGRLALEYARGYPSYEAEIYGRLFAGIFLAAEDAVMFKKYIDVMELAAKETSRFYTPVNNIVMAASLRQRYKRLVGEQKL
jgi:hypothetical protein